MNLRKFSIIALLITAITIFAEIFMLVLTNTQNNKLITITINEFTNQQKQAVDNFFKSIDSAFKVYINNVPNVVQDKPKWRIIWNTITYDKQEAQTIIEEHFKKIFIDNKNTLNTAIDTFNYEQQKAYNNLFEKLNIELQNKNIKQNTSQLKQALSELNSSIISISNKATVLATISAIATEELTRIGITATFSTITATTTTGATSGSFFPVVGTSIGIVVGLATGITADYFIEKKYNKQLSTEIIKALKDSQSKIKEAYKTTLLNDISKQRSIIKDLIANSNKYE
ncbi:MAG: hypothetical protein E7035_03580 [Verrucomicrobiaceae bacterium]|nr:hypothetical protein [Verrucomicrobiaceae bacterium]